MRKFVALSYDIFFTYIIFFCRKNAFFAKNIKIIFYVLTAYRIFHNNPSVMLCNYLLQSGSPKSDSSLSKRKAASGDTRSNPARTRSVLLRSISPLLL